MAKTINTRIQLKYDSLASWQTNNPTLLAGEIACVSIGEVTADNKGNRVIPPIMMKVGPGAFNDLGWTAAKAADVYAWAKKENLEFSDLPLIPVVDDESGKFITDVEYTDAGIVIRRGLVDWNDIQNVPALGTSDQIEDLQKAIDAINKELDTHGDIVTHSVSEFATAAQGTKADNAAVKSEVDAALALKADKSVVDAMYSNSKIDELVAGAKSGAETTAAGALATARTEITAEIGTAIAPLATKEELNGVKTTAEQGVSDAKAAQDKANEVGTKLDTFLGGITPDGSAEIIDTLAEINSFMTEDTGAFVQLSSRVTTAEGDIDTLEGKVSTLEGLVGENGKVKNAETASSLDTAGIEQVKGIKVNNAANADEAAKVAHTLTINGEDFDGSANKSFDLVKSSDFDAFQNNTLPATYKALQTPVEDPTANGETLAFINSISQNANGEITATKKNVKLGDYAKSADLHPIASSGSIYDVAEGSNSGISKVNGEDVAVEYLIFNCGSATTII